MGTVINKHAAIDDILRDVNQTFEAASAAGAPYKEDAVRVLEGSLDLIGRLASRSYEVRSQVATLRARQAAANRRCDERVLSTRDGFYNAAGRPGNDPLLHEMFPAGTANYRKVSVADKPAGLRLLASLIVSSVHPRLPVPLRQAAATELRAAAQALDAVNGELMPLRTEFRLLEAQYGVAARQGQVQLARLKKYWKAAGASEADVHAMIPDRKIGSSAAKAAPVLGVETQPATTPPVVPTEPEQGAPAREQEVAVAK